jgi:sialidase-1
MMKQLDANGRLRMVQRLGATLFILLFSTAPGMAKEAADSSTPIRTVSRTEVFRSGEHGYKSVRIPSVAATNDGTLLAFCEGRKNSRSDAGDIDILLRRSTDGGKTWEQVQKVWDDAENTCGNPCVVVDRTTGHIWLLLCWNAGDNPEHQVKPGFGQDSRRVFVTHSEDNGQTWVQPKEITTDVKSANWSWYATGPGAGIQIQNGDFRGRLIIPCDHKLWNSHESIQYYSHVIFSDDHGATWQRGEATPHDKVNECEVVEVANGRLQLNMRNYDPTVNARQIAYSEDGGVTWHNQHIHEALVEPRCQASVRRHSWPDGDQPGIIFFSNPADGEKRVAMTLRASFDHARTWPVEHLLHAGSSAYSCLVTLTDDEVGCLFEIDSYDKIVFDRVNFEGLQPDVNTSDEVQIEVANQ